MPNQFSLEYGAENCLSNQVEMTGPNGVYCFLIASSFNPVAYENCQILKSLLNRHKIIRWKNKQTNKQTNRQTDRQTGLAAFKMAENGNILSIKPITGRFWGTTLHANKSVSSRDVTYAWHQRMDSSYSKQSKKSTPSIFFKQTRWTWP